MLPLSWRHLICRLATILLRTFHKRTGIPGKTQHSFKAISSDSPNLRRDLTQPLLKSGFFCYQTVEVGKIDFLLPKPVFKLLSGHARVKKIWLLHRFPQKSKTPPVDRVQKQIQLEVSNQDKKNTGRFYAKSTLTNKKVSPFAPITLVSCRLLEFYSSLSLTLTQCVHQPLIERFPVA